MKHHSPDTGSKERTLKMILPSTNATIFGTILAGRTPLGAFATADHEEETDFPSHRERQSTQGEIDATDAESAREDMC
jgi:hypothetical protein